ncbi:helix-turn-helix domain-containing protein [Nocardia crassostreae]|uniref:helix-turn-helix domain-containing protein n=1 Tax=Nocardia crassostreae TaxID=53428 RepID=UPI000A4A14C7|nr:helix-turn-helix domain-containing protein [Nocardia crassostreae]
MRSNSYDEPIGDRVRRLRKERGLTQAALAAKAGCSRSLIQQIENGTRIPQLSLRERLSLALGEALPATGHATAIRAVDNRHDDLRMQFNVLLGEDAAAVERGLRLVRSLIAATRAGPDAQPLRQIAERQLERAEDVLAQVPSQSATVWEWNTVSDWCPIVEKAIRSVRVIHSATLGSIGGEVGEDYHDVLLRLAGRTGASRVDIRRMYVVDDISDVWPYEDKLWRLLRAGVENVVVKREHASNASGLLLVDDRFVVVGEYDHTREARVASRISGLKHDVVFAERRFEKLYRLKRTRLASVVNTLAAAPPLARYADLDDGDCRAEFRAALEAAWKRLP